MSTVDDTRSTIPEMTTGVRPCPYCGGPTADRARCASCKGLLDADSLRVSRDAMGAWFLRDDAQPHRPGCSYATLVRLVERGRVTRESVVRGPTTGQFWALAVRVQGVAHLLGSCHACGASVTGTPSACDACGRGFGVPGDRDALGVRELTSVGSLTPVVPARTSPGPASAPAMPAPAPMPEDDPVMQRLTGRRDRARHGREMIVLAGVLVLTVCAISLGVVVWTRFDASRMTQEQPTESPAISDGALQDTPVAPVVDLAVAGAAADPGVVAEPAPSDGASGGSGTLPTASDLAEMTEIDDLEAAHAAFERALAGASSETRPELEGRLRYLEHRLAMLRLDPDS